MENNLSGSELEVSKEDTHIGEKVIIIKIIQNNFKQKINEEVKMKPETVHTFCDQYG